MTDLIAWKDARNHLMHSMLDESMTEREIGRSAEKLAVDGVELVRLLAASARRLKKHLAKTPSVPRAASSVKSANQRKKLRRK